MLHQRHRYKKKEIMAKDEILRVDGHVVDVLPNANFLVKIGESSILCHLSGKMRKNNIRVMMGDRVEVEMSAYDLSKGRIAYRHK